MIANNMMVIQANAASTAALAEAENAKTTACVALFQGYTHRDASEKEMRQYVSCVERVYPTAESQQKEIIAAKFGIAVVLLATLVGCVVGYRKGDAIYAIAGFACGLFALLTLVAVGFLFLA